MHATTRRPTTRRRYVGVALPSAVALAVVVSTVTLWAVAEPLAQGTLAQGTVLVEGRLLVQGTALAQGTWFSQGTSFSQTVASAPVSTADLEVVQIRPNFYMIAGAGGNVAVQVGGDGVMLVDTGAIGSIDRLAATVKKITPQPIRYIINTNVDADHVGGNAAFLRAGQASFKSIVNQFPPNYFVSGPVAVLASLAVLQRMSAPTGQPSPFPVEAWPTETFETGRRYLYLNDEGIEVTHQPAAHTDGDSVVFFRRSDVIVAGDIFDTTRFPVIDVVRGGSLQGTIDALNRLVATAIPSLPDVSREAGTSVIPGHGHVGDQFDLLNYRDMLVIVRDHVQDLIKANRTLEQIKAASPARGFLNRYGASSGSWTTDDFIEAVYRSLVDKKS